MKTVIRTGEMDYSLKDLEVMLVFLKILIYYAQKDKNLSLSRWQAFFTTIFPDAVVDDGVTKAVYGLNTAKKYLEENGYLKVTKPKGKRYKLYKLQLEQLQKVGDILQANLRDYDQQLLEDIKEYEAENDNGGKNFNTSEDAFKSIGL